MRSLAQNHLHVEFDFNRARARLAVEAIQNDILEGYASPTAALGIGLNVSLTIAVEFKEADCLALALQTCTMQPVIVVGFGKLAGNVGSLAGRWAACGGRAGCRSIFVGKRWMVELVGVVQATDVCDVGREIGRERWLRGIGKEIAPV